MSTSTYGLVTGRIASIFVDPSDTTGNTVYVGTTGGGLWVSQNAATTDTSKILFHPLTDNLGVLNGVGDASISVGAVSMQPGGTGVILAGTGDPNDALDSYYGTGVLRSTDGGTSWSLIQGSSDGLWRFLGEGFAGFAWSTANPQLVVAAVSQAYAGTLDDAPIAGASYQGLYYSADAGATWSLATITDGTGSVIQGPTMQFVQPDGNAATSVVWNPVRGVFIAAVRYHGYYQSADGVTWTRLAAQPGANLTAAMCPANAGSTGSVACPIFRGTLAVNPVTGDTFAWTVDANNRDQGIWRDVCAMSSGACANPVLAFSTPINTAALEVDQPPLGAAVIANGDYNLALAAVPAGQDTLLLAGGNDLWKCSLAAGCAWRNTTNAVSCMSAQVGEYQHALGWNASDPQQIFIGNDSGLWRSTDAIAESGSACNPDDAAHFQNLNASLGSLAEVNSLAQVTTSSYTQLVGLGVNGAAGVKSASGIVAQWPQVLGGEGGPVAIDPVDPTRWYVNNQAGVSIHVCAQAGACTPASFGTAPVVNDDDVGGDGYTMTLPAPFLVDPLDHAQLLVGTCRVWRGPADGSLWSSANAISPFLDNVAGSTYCNGNAQIRSMAAAALPNGGEVIYVGMYGALDGGAMLAGHVLGATYVPGSGSTPVWQDLTLNPVTNDDQPMNAQALDISGIYIDPHDATGNTVYVTVQGIWQPSEKIRMVYRSTDGGAHWAFASLGLPRTSANGIVVDPLDENTVYLATDAGVYVTRQIAACIESNSTCWTAYGAGLPLAPVTQLSVAPAAVTPSVLVAGTYGRGIWQIPLATAGTQLTTATADPASLDFGAVAYGASSSAQTVEVTNTGGVALAVSSITASGDFSETDDCRNTAVNAGASCAVQVTFTPSQTGNRTGQLAIAANVAGGQLNVALSGTGSNPASFSILPAQLNFGQVAVGSTSSPLQITVQNTQSTAVSIGSVSVTAPFALQSNACGSAVAGQSSCQLTVAFAPTQAGTATGTLTLASSAGAQTVSLAGVGATVATGVLSSQSLAFAGTVIGQSSAAQTVSLTNNGDLLLTSIAVSAIGAFQTSNTCGTQLTGHASCAIRVVFAPQTAGAQTGTLTVADSVGTQTAALSGTGLLPPVIVVSPASLAFAAQQVGAAGTPQPLTISNAGGAPMAGLGFSITGASASSFSVGATTCGATLNNGSSCTVQVAFTPKTVGGSTATLTVTSSSPGVKAVSVALSGTATAAAGLNISPAQMAFVSAAPGQASAPQTATLSNTGASAAAGLAFAIAPPFSLAQNTCGASLASGSNCTVGIVFTPAASGTVSGVLTVSSANLNAAQVLLSGSVGAAGTVSLQPSTLAFATVGVGNTGNAQTVTVTNTSQVPLTNLALRVSSGFQLGGTTCVSLLAAGASCTASVVFAPTATGPQTGTLTVSSSALPAGAQAALSGTGFDFTFAAGSASQTVASGQTATFTLTLASFGTAATFTYSCGSLPAYAACSFNPGNTTVSAGGSGSVTLRVATGQSAAANPLRRLGWTQGIALCGLVLLPWAWRRKRRALFLLVLLAALAGGAGGCTASGGGSGGAASGGGSNTTAGTYTIQITATADGLSRTAQVSLTVD